MSMLVLRSFRVLLPNSGYGMLALAEAKFSFISHWNITTFMSLSSLELNFRLAYRSESGSENKSIAVQYQLQLYVIRIHL